MTAVPLSGKDAGDKEATLAWDPDFTKLTKEEAEELAEAENSGFVREDEIDWSKIGW